MTDTCPKCGSEAHAAWHVGPYAPSLGGARCSQGEPGALDPYGRSFDEHLHYRCHCGYGWTAPTKDADQ